MKIQIFASIALLQICMLDAAKTPHSIVLNFEPYPFLETIDKKDREITSVINPKKKVVKSPHHTHIKKKSKKNRNPINVNGIPLIYYGYITYCPQTGIVMFPRMHENPEFYVLVCSKKNSCPIEPIFMIKNTIHHIELAKDATYEFYLITKKFDELTKSYLWHVEKKPLPDDKQLPLETIIIFADPQDLFIPEGICLTNDNAQAVLPAMYVKNDKNQVRNNFAALEISYLFELIEPVKK